MVKQNINLKDLMTVAIFFVVTTVIGFTTAMLLGSNPLTYLMITPIGTIVNGIPIILFFSKIKKFGMILILQVLAGMLSLAFSMGFYPLVLGVLSGLGAELLLRKGGYKSTKMALLAYVVFAIGGCANYIPLLTGGARYIETMTAQYGPNFGAGLSEYASNYALLGVVLAATVLCGVLGGFLGIAVFRRHFARSAVA